MRNFCVVDYARGGRSLRTFETREEAMQYADSIRDPRDPKRYRAERFFEGETEELTHA